MAQHVSQHPMRWADLDAAGRGSGTSVARYLQEARVDLLFVHAAAQGAAALASGVVLVRTEIEHVRPFGWSDAPVAVTTWATRVEAARFGLAYEVATAGAPGAVVARAATTVAPYDRATSRSRRLSPVEREVLGRYLHPELPGPVEPGVAPAGAAAPPAAYDCAVRFDDLDGYGHVNNTTYLDYLQDARRRYTAEVLRSDPERTDVVHQEVRHRAPIPFRTVPVQVQCRLLARDERHWVLGYRIGAGPQEFAVARSTQAARR